MEERRSLDKKLQELRRAELARLGEEELLAAFSGFAGAQGDQDAAERAGLAIEEWAARGLGSQRLDRELRKIGEAGEGEGCWDWCRAQGLHRAGNALVRAGSARWESSKARAEAAKLPWAHLAPEGLSPLAESAWRLATAIWRDATGGNGSGAERGSPQWRLAQDCLGAISKFACCSEQAKGEVVAGAGMAARFAASEKMGEAAAASASAGAKRISKAFAAGAMSARLEGDLAILRAAGQARQEEIAAWRRRVKPWEKAAKAAIACDSPEVMLHLAREAKARGCALAEEAGSEADSDQGSLLGWALSAKAWACAAELARRGAPLRRELRRGAMGECANPFGEPVTGNPFEEMAGEAASGKGGGWEQGRSEAFMAVGMAVAKQRALQGAEEASAAAEVEALAEKAWRWGQPQFAQAKAAWEAQCIQLSVELGRWARGPAKDARERPDGAAPRL